MAVISREASTIQFHNNIYGEKKAFSVSANCIEIRGEFDVVEIIRAR